MSLRDQLLRELYAKLPRLRCRGLCQEACGPIGGSAYEIQRLELHGCRKLETNADLTCSMLNEYGRCVTYAVRPMVCRLFGLVESMPCPYGCVPSRWLTHAEGQHFLRKAGMIGGEDAFSAPGSSFDPDEAR